MDINVEIYPMKVRNLSLANAVRVSTALGKGEPSCVWLALRGTRLKANDKFAFALSSTLAEDGTPDDGAYEQVRAGA